MRCPGCDHEMRAVAYEGVEIQTCDGCGAEFVGSGELRHIVETREARFPESEGIEWEAVKPMFGVPAGERARTLTCPACSANMEVVNYCGDSGVFVDRCASCGGMFLDHDELESVQILLERWADDAPEKIQGIAGRLEEARREAAASTDACYEGSRFSFVNALINRFLDAG